MPGPFSFYEWIFSFDLHKRGSSDRSLSSLESKPAYGPSGVKNSLQDAGATKRA
jgi:hypothetical protein